MLIIQGFLSPETLSHCSRIRLLATHQVQRAIDQADKSGRHALRKKLHVVETLLKKAKSSALFDSRRPLKLTDLADTLPDLSDLLTTAKFGSWMQKANLADFRATVQRLSQVQREKAWRTESLPASYAQGSFVTTVYEHDVPRYRAIRSTLAALRSNSVSLSNIHNIALASRYSTS